MSRVLHLVDGSGYIFRAYHALPPMTRPDGTPVNAIYGFTAMLLKLISDLKADHLAVIFDSKRETFRNAIYPAYKAQRPPPPEDLVPQFPLIREAVVACQVACLEKEGFEADDLIATLATRAAADGWDVVVVSADKDLMQLVRPGVQLFDPMKNKPIDADAVREKFGVVPEKVIDVQALAGDSSDNVPGVPGIGVKTAAQLIETYGDLETLLGRAAEITQPKRRQSLIDFAEQARISKRLVTLACDVPLDVGPDDLKVPEFDLEKLRAFLDSYGFKSLLARLPGLRRGDAPAAAEAEPVAEGFDPSAYGLLTDAAALERFLARAADVGRLVVSVESENRRLVGLGLAIAPGEAVYLPLRHGLLADAAPAGTLDFGVTPADAPAQVPLTKAVELLRPVLADPGVLVVGHDVKAAMHALAAEGLTVAVADDTMVLSYALDGAAHGHGIDELALRHFGHRVVSREELCGKGRSRVGWDTLAPEAVRICAAETADVVGRLHAALKRRLLEERRVGVYERFDRPLVKILHAMEAEGVAIDSAALAAMSRDFGGRMAALEAECHRLAGGEFNLGSPKQLGEILFERLSLPGGRKSGKTGAWGTDAEVLEELALVHELPARILDWRQLQKLKSTYADALVGQISPVDGRVHTTFALTVTATGRLSSIDPNLQNIPIRTEEGRRIREAFVAAPGNVLVSADYSQIELRLMAHVGEVAALKAAFASGEDIHAATASQVFGVPIAGMDPMLRRRAKAINFGIIYGISAFGLARQLGIANAEAKGYIAAYFEKYPEIRQYMESTKEFARAHGFVRTPFGRVCATPGIAAKIPAQRGFAERAAINAPIQGGAADIMKRAMIRVDAALADANLRAKAVLQVHDELVFEVAADEAEALIALIRPEMEAAAALSVPLVVDARQGRTWAAAH
ncbi:fused DNA polymerase I 5'-_3' exonuclease; 3'-_5' polymerase; 3'-_5' exonuclease [uncultured Alphaproteobacteria bacterium]|uniref:DNA polymerase I n=1 Tax=uncultured Alphaproteobacteria bacterium TaxID=91750 RepID=A0A212KK28_9PROT|nr:fused DNA polymerase I 5'->3' exonuclease; 3'->5' polymerase; 3'->5' exonuclease [uncultured Alphaproteobacteria bacterium]